MSIDYPPDAAGRVGAYTLRVRCAYCRRFLRRHADLQVLVHDHELVCPARPVLLQLWADHLARAKAREARTSETSQTWGRA